MSGSAGDRSKLESLNLYPKYSFQGYGLGFCGWDPCWSPKSFTLPEVLLTKAWKQLLLLNPIHWRLFLDRDNLLLPRLSRTDDRLDHERLNIRGVQMLLVARAQGSVQRTLGRNLGFRRFLLLDALEHMQVDPCACVCYLDPTACVRKSPSAQHRTSCLAPQSKAPLHGLAA